MRYLLLLAIVFVSLCTQLPIEIPFLTPSVQQSSFALEVTSDPDIYLKVETLPKEVKEGKNISMIFEVRNEANSDLENINVYAYDQCVFSGDNKKSISMLKPDRTERWTWKWKAGNIELPTDCNIKFRTDYENDFSLSQDVAVLTESEYYIKEQEGILEDIPISSSSSSSPLSISVGFLENQPFVDGDEVTMSIGYSYIGEGIMNISDITISIPSNLEFVSCSDYNKVDTSLKLTRKLNFINNKASSSNCKFTTKASQPMGIKSLSLTARYKYVLDNSISVRVKK